MRILITAKCNRCLGSATGKTFDEASSNIDHSVGLTRSIPCGANYNRVIEVKDTSKTDKDTFTKVEKKSSEKIIFDETKYSSTKKPKK